LQFEVWIKRMEIDFLRPVVGDRVITITSFVREFRGSDGLAARRHGDFLREANMTDRGLIRVDFVHLRSGCDSLR
jgi:hypothetical protein